MWWKFFLPICIIGFLGLAASWGGSILTPGGGSGKTFELVLVMRDGERKSHLVYLREVVYPI